MTQYRCKNPARALLLAQPGLDGVDYNGIDYLEVLDEEAPSPAQRQRTLLLRCFKAINPPLRQGNVRLEGGVRVKGVRVRWAYVASEFSTNPADAASLPNSLVTLEERRYFTSLPDPQQVLVIRTEQEGDYSSYTLRLVQSPSTPAPPAGFDAQLAEVEFSFKVECPSDFDCAPGEECPPGVLPEPRLDYLAKDYASFRRLMLDRLALLMPGGQEGPPADLQVVLVELLAYVGDHLSYYQDAVATEAYLGTARQRVSLRRHARLLDYPMHDGCNARAWVCLEVAPAADGLVLPGPDPSTHRPGSLLLTRLEAAGTLLSPDQLAEALTQTPEAFETLHDLPLFQAHNRIALHTWGDEACCLPKGATRATLQDPGAKLRLEVGDYLLFEEVRGAKSGLEADADRQKRHVVRLSRVTPGLDPLVPDPANPAQPLPLLEVEWAVADALPFALCLSGVVEGQPLTEVSVARGNVALADHGRTQGPEELRAARRPPHALTPGRGPVTQRAPFDPQAPAQQAPRWEMSEVRPAMVLFEGGDRNLAWQPRRDLLASDRFAREFVLEVAEDGRGQLRFGDDVLGQAPTPGVAFEAVYRVGNGPAGNVGAEAIAHLVRPQGFPAGGVLRVRNPLPAVGGLEPESPEAVRQYAPQAFRRQERAVTEADYAEVTQRHPEVQKAAATFRWTGSWYTVFVSVDRKGGRPVDAAFEEELLGHLERFRMAGYDLEIDGPRFVPVDLALEVCVAAGQFRSGVEAALEEAFSTRELPTGPAFFHPDRFSFGDPLYLSQVYRQALAVPGVASVEVRRFQRFGKTPARELEEGVLSTGRLEVIRLDNDPSRPEFGRLELAMKGGL